MPFEASLNLKGSGSWDCLVWVQSFACQKALSISCKPLLLSSTSLPVFFLLVLTLGTEDVFPFNFYLLSPSRYYFPLLSLLAFTPPSLLLKSLRTSASWLCLSLISFCQAFVFDHRSFVSTLLLLLFNLISPPILLIAHLYCVCARVQNVFLNCVSADWWAFNVCEHVQVTIRVFSYFIDRSSLCAQTYLSVQL